MVELVIKIPEEKFSIIKNKMYCGIYDPDLYKAIENGTPLPKGHGDLKDANNLKHAFISWSMVVQGFFTDSDIASIVYNSPTIIEADTAERGKTDADSN